jgi:hypothetical protein
VSAGGAPFHNLNSRGSYVSCLVRLSGDKALSRGTYLHCSIIRKKPCNATRGGAWTTGERAIGQACCNGSISTV